MQNLWKGHPIGWLRKLFFKLDIACKLLSVLVRNKMLFTWYHIRLWLLFKYWWHNFDFSQYFGYCFQLCWYMERGLYSYWNGYWKGSLESTVQRGNLFPFTGCKDFCFFDYMWTYLGFRLLLSSSSEQQNHILQYLILSPLMQKTFCLSVYRSKLLCFGINKLGL